MASDGDIIHEQVEKFLLDRPEFRSRIQRTGDGEYRIEGRDVKVGFCRQGYLVAHDGPLRQPFVDYVEKKEDTAIYHNGGLKKSTLNQLDKEARLSFGDEENRYSRLDAMKIAKEQALFREKAATYQAEGQMVPLDLKEKYEKAIDIKLGKRQWRQQPRTTQHAPSWWPGATQPSNTASPSPAATPVASPAAVPTPQQQHSLHQPRPQPASAAPMAQQVVATAPAQVLGAGPLPSMPQATKPQSLFGPMPDLFAIAASRAQGTSTPAATLLANKCQQAPMSGFQARVMAAHGA